MAANAAFGLGRLRSRAVKEIRGFVPFYKEANVAHSNVRDWLKLHLEHEWGTKMKTVNVMYRVSKCPEMPFQGICFMTMGTDLCRHIKYYQDLECEHIITLKMGVSTNTGALIPGTNSHVTSTTDVSTLTYDDIFFIIKKKIDYTTVTLYNKFDPIFSDNFCHVIDPSAWYDGEDIQEYKKNDSFLRWFTRPDLEEDTDPEDEAYGLPGRSWRYRLQESPFEVRFKQVTILNYDAPFLTLKVESNGRFNGKSLASHFKDISGIDCCVTASDRISFGPVRKQDCLLKHQMYYPELKASATKWTPILLSWMARHKLKNAVKHERRLRF